MNISIIQQVREADQSNRLTTLVNGMCEDDADDDGIHVIAVEKVMHQMENVRFSVGTGHHLKLLPMTRKSRGKTKTIVISEDENGRVIKREKIEEGYVVYDFLKDYLGLGHKEPLSPAAMLDKYPELKLNLDGLRAQQSWCDAITMALLRNARSHIYGPTTD